MALPALPTTSAWSQATIGRLLDEGYLRSAERVIAVMESDLQSNGGLIQTRLRQLREEADRLQAEGKTRFTRDNPVMRAFLADYRDVMDKEARILAGASPTIQESAARFGEQSALQNAYFGASPQIRAAIDAEWAAADPETVNRLLRYADGAAWERQINKDFRGVAKTVRNHALRNIAIGRHATAVVRDLARIGTEFPLHRAHTQMRTLYMESYRKAETIHQNENVNMIGQVWRIETRDKRTCVMCISLDGTLLWDAERDRGQPIPDMFEHFRGRGRKRTVVKGVNRPPPTRGEDWFRGLPEERQREHFTTPGKFAAWKRGDAQLGDFIKQRNDPIFGQMMQERSLRDINKRARRRRRGKS